MPWARLQVEPETTMEVVPANGRKYLVTWRSGRAYLPLHLHNWLISQGVAVHSDEPDPKVRFEKLGSVHSAPISPFSDYCREVTS
jgi:hypothetical protein